MKQSNAGNASRRVGASPRVAGCGLGLAVMLCAGACWAQASGPSRQRGAEEIAPFRLTGIEGYAQARFLQDDNRSQAQRGRPESRARQSILTEEVYLMTHSYIYHPGLISLDLGGGPVLEKGSNASDAVASSSRRQMVNLNARATVLRDKPYNGALFYDRGNQTQSIGPAQVMLTEHTRYGLDFALLRPVTPVPVQLNVTRMQTQGSGADQILDDRTDQLNLRMEGNLGSLGTTALQYRNGRQESVSGSPGLPIQAVNSTSENINLDTRLRFGANQQYDLANVVTLNTHRFAGGSASAADLRDARFGLDLRGTHSEDLRTFARYNLSATDQGDQTMTANSLGAGVNYRLNPEWSASLAARADVNRTSQLASNQYGVDGAGTYQKTLPLGRLTAGYSFAYTQRDQHATGSESRAVGEQRTLSSTTPVPLSRPLIVAGSVAVSNLTRTQTFVEGRDYVLSVIGLDTRLQRVIGGNILDGQEVLVDYAFEVGGTYAVNQLDQAVSLDWGFKNYLNVYARLTDSSPELRSGTPTSPLNPGRSRLFGTRGELPLEVPMELVQDLLVGGRAEWEDRREAISPYERATQEVFTQVALPLVYSGNVRLGRRHTRTDYSLDPGKGINATAYDLRLWARFGYGVDISLDATRERDTGGPVLRERSLLSAKAQWRVRRFRLTFDLTHSHDAEGAIERNRTVAMLLARRDF